MPKNKKITFSDRRNKKPGTRIDKGGSKKFKSSNEPSDEELNYLLSAFQNGQFDQAEKLAGSLTERFPNHPFPWKVMGVLLQARGKLNESLVACQKSAQLSPQDADAHNNLGITLHALGRLEEASVFSRG